MYGLYYAQNDGKGWGWTVRYSLNGICVYQAKGRADALHYAAKMNTQKDRSHLIGRH